MNAKTKIGIGMKTKVKTKTKTKKKNRMSTSGSETQWYIANFANVGRGRIINRWSGMAKAVSDSKVTRRSLRSCSVTIARWKITIMDCILHYTNMERDYISARTNRTGCNNKEKKTPKKHSKCLQV